MGGMISVLISILAAVSFFNTGHTLIFWICIFNLVLSIWSWGVMHNFAIRSAKSRMDKIRENMIQDGRSSEEIGRLDKSPIHLSNYDIIAVPDWLTRINILVTFCGFGLLIWGIIIRFF